MAEEKTKTLLGGFMSADRIIFMNGSVSKEDVLNKLVDSLAQISPSGSRDEIAAGVFHRESLMSTAIGNGIALPHFKLNSIDDSYIALAVCPDGVSDYLVKDGQMVKLVFMILAGSRHKLQHVKLMNVISNLFFDGRLKAAFIAAGDGSACMEILKRAEC